MADFTVISEASRCADGRSSATSTGACIAACALQACPTYRQLGVEMDSPRGRIYQMVQVANGEPITDAYREHIDLCLACRACETACPSGVEYGRLVEAARSEIEAHTERSWRRSAVPRVYIQPAAVFTRRC